MNAIDQIKTELAPYTLEIPEKKPRQNYVSILILRELLSAARFTTDGTEANSSVIRIGEEEVTVGKLFGRKQVASDRRIAKAVQRDLIADKMNDIQKGGWKGCSMDVNKMCQRCPECALFGSAASEDAVSITSRVMYDEAYTIRSISAVVEEFFQNAPGDEYAKRATSSIREPDFFKEGTLFPCVVTLRDVTPEEVLFFLNITDRNTRYGATGTRFGKTQNHILGVFVGHREGPSSLEITKGIVSLLSGYNKSGDKSNLQALMQKDSLPVDAVKRAAIEVYESIAQSRRVGHKRIDDSLVTGTLKAMEDEREIAGILTTQVDKVVAFVDVPKEK